jgi:hypothetical protein
MKLYVDVTDNDWYRFLRDEGGRMKAERGKRKEEAKWI